MYDDDEYTQRRRKLQIEANQIVKLLEDFDPMVDEPAKMAHLFHRMKEIENAYEDLIIELDVEVLLLKVHEQLVNEGYLKDEE